ncbi:Hypothetical Protein OBI_RACECAR_7 [Arthrobacter phage Racecar]|nr:hypothetical protein PBI_RACECAR_88 [Arthrobacter phage Racecar]
MKVSMFRVEKPCGAGPYVGEEENELLKHMFTVHGDADHLEPWDDPMLGEIYPDEVCGFATLCALEEWFAGYEDPLTMCGYSIVVYTVPLNAVRYGKKQALFIKDQATAVRTMPMF